MGNYIVKTATHQMSWTLKELGKQDCGYLYGALP